MQSLARDGSKDPFETVPIHAIIRDVLEVSAEGLKKAGVQLQYTGYSENPRVYCKPTQISQVLMNLINNARDALESNQEITERWIRIEVSLNIDTVNVAVVDSGRGIPADIAARIMEPFYTTKEAGKGCGLGLSIAQTIMSHHRGSLKLDEAHASGHTCFIMTMPQGPLK
jgi:signal transduction histidine kinase